MSYILVVDDNLDTQDILTRVFQKAQLPCLTADNGQKAMELVKAGRPALIITDLMMPKSSGFSLLGNLQADPATRGIPVVVLSGIATPAIGRLPNVIEVIQKGSLDLRHLRDLAEQTLAASKGAAADKGMASA